MYLNQEAVAFLRLKTKDSSNIVTMNHTDTLQKIYFLPRLWGKHVGQGLVCFFAILGNGTLIYIIASHKHLRTITNAFIVSLATADLLIGFPTIPFHIIAEEASGPVFGYSLGQFCVITMSITSFQIAISPLTLLALTMERYLCIVFPLKHRKWAHPHSAGLLLLGLWVYCLVFGAIPLMGWNALRYHDPWEPAANASGGENETVTLLPRCSFLVIHTGPYMGIGFLLHMMPLCLITPYVYCHMYQVVRRFLQRKKEIAQTQQRQCGRDVINDEGETALDAKHRRANQRSLRLLFVMFVYFLFSWFPLVLWYIVATKGFTRTHLTVQDIKNIPIPWEYYQTVIVLGMANSAINPFIYGLGNVRIRHALLRTWRQIKRCSCNEVDTTSTGTTITGRNTTTGLR